MHVWAGFLNVDGGVGGTAVEVEVGGRGDAGGHMCCAVRSTSLVVLVQRLLQCYKLHCLLLLFRFQH
jgi:hypothetical protein